MNVLAQSGTLGGSEGQPATVRAHFFIHVRILLHLFKSTFLKFAETTAETLLTDLKNRRARRKGVVSF